MADRNLVLLLGAGFSRNWGGWLADEAFEYLIGCQKVTPSLRSRLWRHHLARTGFEGALAELQGDPTVAEERLTLLECIKEMFSDMNRGFANNLNFNLNNQTQRLLSTFLHRFDTIFSLNQDLLLEMHYLSENLTLSHSRQWSGYQFPGMRRVSAAQNSAIENRPGIWVPLPATGFKVNPKSQPIFKLHGSSNWQTEEGAEILIMGGAKEALAAHYPILGWYQTEFGRRLSLPNTRLMTIGYSFRDDHINKAIQTARARGELKLFIIDPLGVEVLKDKRNTGYDNDAHQYVVGASRRTLDKIFGDDDVEFGKVMRFLT